MTLDRTPDDTLEARLVAITDALSNLQIEAAAARVHRQEQQRNIERFWAKDWADLVGKIDRVAVDQTHLEVRLRNVETLLHNTPERLAKLEGKCDAIEKRIGTMATTIVVVGIIALGQAGARFAAFF